MRKIIFYVSIVFCIVLMVHIFNIITQDLDRLTQYGYGFLVGKIMLLVAFLAAVFLSRNKR